jgi:hypothetical protein
MTCAVILSEAKNLSSIYVWENKQREILRFAQNDSVLSFSAGCSAFLVLRPNSIKTNRLKPVLLEPIAGFGLRVRSRCRRPRKYLSRIILL